MANNKPHHTRTRERCTSLDPARCTSSEESGKTNLYSSAITKHFIWECAPAGPAASRFTVLQYKLEDCVRLAVILGDQPVNEAVDVVINVLGSELEHLLLKLFSEGYQWTKVATGWFARAVTYHRMHACMHESTRYIA